MAPGTSGNQGGEDPVGSGICAQPALEIRSLSGRLEAVLELVRGDTGKDLKRKVAEAGGPSPGQQDLVLPTGSILLDDVTLDQEIALGARAPWRAALAIADGRTVSATLTLVVRTPLRDRADFPPVLPCQAACQTE